ncbi:MAG TPA: ParB/RepB/Spo0J family partition protein [Candidatus Paceibacterota bacterium]
MPEEAPYSNSIFLIEVGKISPNPFQPRKEFDEVALRSLAESIKQYGVLQPLVVTRKEVEKPEGGLAVEYELIAGERRLRASKLAGLATVPAVIRVGEQSDKVKLEIAIIENLQREDLNPVDRAEAFKKLLEDFGYKQQEVATKIGMSREYVSNSVRILMLPPEIIEGLRKGEISEGHTRPLLMLTDRKPEQTTLYKDIVTRRLTVREAERAARNIAVDKQRKLDKNANPEMLEAEEHLRDMLGTAVEIQKKLVGGKIVIDFYSPEDLKAILAKLEQGIAPDPTILSSLEVSPEVSPPEGGLTSAPANLDDRSNQEKQQDDADLYSVTNFTI